MEEKYLILLQMVSAGQNGPDLGCDEEQIVYLLYAILDVHRNKVVSQHSYHVRPTTSDINENLLSEQCRTDYGLTEVSIKEALPLDAIVRQFDAELTSRGLEAASVCLVTDGQLAIRQSLFPEAQRKGISLPSYYYRFHDLRKEFSSAYPDSAASEVEDMLKFLDLNVDNDLLLAERQMQAMAKVLHKLICDGVKLHEPDRVVDKLEQSIRSREDSVDSSCCVRARGLPWQASDQDIARFFIGLNVARGGVALCLSSQGRRNGEAIVLFDSVQHRDLALKRHKHHIGNRYIEVYKATGEDFINVAGGNNVEAQKFLSRQAQVIIRMRGLPYDASAKQVIEFFASGENACSLVDGEDGVLFVKKPDGRATGDAFVLLAEEQEAEKALHKHKENMGSRYIELFRSTTAEVQQVLNRTMEKHSNNLNKSVASNLSNGVLSAAPSNIPLIPHLPSAAPAAAVAMPVLPQQMITAGTRKDCIRLRGLPYEAQVEHILEFLGDHAKSIIYQGVHMVYNAQGQPSGEAFIQMSSESAAFQAAQQRHHRDMVFGKKQRYIEVFQCSGEDMNHVLTGGTTTNAATAASTASPVKAATTVPAVPATTASTSSHSAAAAAAAAAAGLLPPGMFSVPQAAAAPSAASQTTFGTGLDPNAILAAQMQSPFLIMPPQAASAPRAPNASTADMVALQQQQYLRQHMAYGPAAAMQLHAVQAQQQLQFQQQLLQSQLAAQRLLLSSSGSHPVHAMAAAGLIGPRPPPPHQATAKRSFDQAFTANSGGGGDEKRAAYTISAGPTTYSR